MDDIITLIIGFALGLVAYHGLLKKQMQKKNRGKLGRIIDILKEENGKKKEGEE